MLNTFTTKLSGYFNFRAPGIYGLNIHLVRNAFGILRKLYSLTDQWMISNIYCSYMYAVNHLEFASNILFFLQFPTYLTSSAKIVLLYKPGDHSSF